MATYDYSSATGGSFNLENRYFTVRVTIGASGETLVTVRAWLSESSTNNAHGVKAICFRSSDSAFIAESDARADIQTGALTAYDFTFSVPPSLSNVDYDIGLFVGPGAGNLVWEGDTTTGTFRFMIVATYPTIADPASWSTTTGILRMLITTNDPGGSSTTVTPTTGDLSMLGRTPTVNSFSAVAIREVLINEAGSPVANRTGIHLHVWYAGNPHGAPDLSYSDLTTDADGTASWSLPIGGLTFNQTIFYVATDGGASLSEYTCARMIPTYS